MNYWTARFFTILAIFAIIGVIATCTRQAHAITVKQDDVIITNDIGGVIGLRLIDIEIIRNRGSRVIIDGDCISSCTFYINLKEDDLVCYRSPSAKFVFHKPSEIIGDRLVLSNGIFFLIFHLREVQLWLIEHGYLFLTDSNDLLIEPASTFVKSCSEIE